MSSLRNAVRRREHKERSQPKARQRYGLLEKHKDYVVRAKNYNEKKKKLKSLKEKAFARNPDEFYFKMLTSRTKVRAWRGQAGRECGGGEGGGERRDDVLKGGAGCSLSGRSTDERNRMAGTAGARSCPAGPLQ